MALAEDFRQTVVKGPSGLEGPRLPSRLPSGPQQAGSPLLAELVEQLAYGIQVADFATHVLIPTARGPVEVDAVVESCADTRTVRARWTILVEDGARLGAEDLAALRDWCAENRTDIRKLSEGDVRTTFLDNVRRLAHTGRRLPDAADPALGTLLRLVDGPTSVPGSVASVIDAMERAGVKRDHARATIEECVASGFIGCDLTIPFDDDAVLTRFAYGFEDPQDNRRDPILVAIMAAEPG